MESIQQLQQSKIVKETCYKCGRYYTVISLDRHRLECGKVFMCDFEGCGKVFQWKQSLRRHERTHRETIKCRGCAKILSSANSLANHEAKCFHPYFAPSSPYKNPPTPPTYSGSPSGVSPVPPTSTVPPTVQNSNQNYSNYQNCNTAGGTADTESNNNYLNTVTSGGGSSDNIDHIFDNIIKNMFLQRSLCIPSAQSAATEGTSTETQPAYAASSAQPSSSSSSYSVQE